MELLPASGNERRIVDLTAVARAFLEIEVKVIKRRSAILDDDKIGDPLAAVGHRKWAPQCRLDPVVMPLELADAGHRRDLDASPHEAADIGDDVQSTGVRGKISLRGYVLDVGSLIGDKLGANEGRMAAILVENEHIAGRRHVAGEDVPGRRRQLATVSNCIVMRQPSGRDDDDIRRESQDLFFVGQGIVAKRDAKAFAFSHAPIDDAHHFGAALHGASEPHLTTRFRCRFEDDDLVPALG